MDDTLFTPAGFRRLVTDPAYKAEVIAKQVEASKPKPTPEPSPLAVFARAKVQHAPTWAFKLTDPLETLPEDLRAILYPFLPTDQGLSA